MSAGKVGNVGVALLIWFTFASGSATAQVDSLRNDTLRFRLQPINVRVLRSAATELKTPAAVTAVSRSELQDGQLTIGLDESLAVVPGVVINNRYNFSLGSRIAVRGLGARAAFGVRGVRVLQDGIPLTMPDGQANLNNIDLGSAGRIEVLRGPASSLYGNAAGGVVAIETEPAPQSAFAGEVRSLAGNVGQDEFSRLSRHQLKVGGRSAAFDYLVSASHLETDGFRAHSRAEQSVLNTRLHLTRGQNQDWTLLLNLADSPTAENPGSLPLDSARAKPEMAWPRNVVTGAGEETRQLQAGVAYQWRGPTSDLQASVYGLTRSLDNPLPFAFITLERKGAGARALYSHRADLSGRSLSVTVGADLEHQADERGEFDNVNGQQGSQRSRDQTDRVSAVGPFAQAELAITPRFGMTLGARYDLIQFEVTDRHLVDGRDDSGSRTLSALSPRLALLYAINDNTSAYGSVGTAFQTPTTTELINRPPEPGEPCCPGGFNRELEPQRALNFELGVKGRLSDRLRYEAALYQMNIQDMLIPFQVATADAREFFSNAGEARHRGLELALAAVLARNHLLEVAYTYSDFAFAADSLADNAVPGVPPQHLFARLGMQLHRNLRLEIEDEFTDSYFANDVNTAKNASVNVIDVRVQGELRAAGLVLRPFVALNNVTDEQYNSSIVINAVGGRFFEPAPGRNLYFGAGVRFGGW
jgi:iron complex outermembrane recepter protein